MKKLIILIALYLFPVYAYSFDQFKPDTALPITIIHEYWQDSIWLLEGKEVNGYDYLKRQVFHNESWLGEPADGQFWNYGNDSTKYEKVWFYYDSNSMQWLISRRDSFYVHPESDTSITLYNRNGAWEYATRIVNNYDYAGNLIEQILYNYSNDWENDSRLFYKYDFRGNLIFEFYQVWDRNTSSWQDNYKKHLYYNMHGKLKMTKDSLYDVNLSVWYPRWRTSYKYYYQGCYFIIETYVQEWFDSIFYDYSIIIDTLKFGQVIGTLGYGRATIGDSLELWYKLSYSYDFMGNLIEQLSYLYSDSGSWILNRRDRYEYAYFICQNSADFPKNSHIRFYNRIRDNRKPIEPEKMLRLERSERVKVYRDVLK